MENARPVIFHRKDCSKCKRALYYLQTRSVAHDAVEVQEGTDSLEQLKKATQQSSTPAFVFEEDHIHDFDVAELALFLRKHHLDPAAPR